MQRWLGQLVQDLSYAMRSFRRSPAFTFVALLSLTLGIGATSAIFSVIYGVLISPYPYARPAEIWAPQVRSVDGRGGHATTAAEVRQLAELPAFSDVMATSFETVLLTGDHSPESFGGVLLTGNAFNFLGVPPTIGRTIQPSDIRADGNAEPVVGVEPQAVVAALSGESRRARQDAAAERPAAHHHRRDAAALRMVRQRRLLAALVAHQAGPSVCQPDRPPRARHLQRRSRGTAARLHAAPGA